MIDDTLIDDRQLAELTKISASMWRKRRLTGDTPPFLKIGKSVRYRLSVVQAWLLEHERNSTSDTGAARAA